MRFPLARLFLIYFCVHILCPPVFADTESGSLLPDSQSQPQSQFISVVISEVMWMGSDLSTADEWLEIAGVQNGPEQTLPRSLSGWTISILKTTGESVIARFPKTASISSGSYLVISNYGKDASRLANDPFLTSTSLSLPNTKLLLRLRDASGALIDEVDDGVGDPFAGANPPNNGPKASMERQDLHQPGTLQSNWKTATTSMGFDPGFALFGTPGFPNSRTNGASSSSVSSSSSSALSSAASSVSSSSFSSASSLENSSINIQVQPLIMLKINELLSDPIGSDDDEWIEVFNTGNIPVNLSGMTIRIGTVGHRIHSASVGMIVAPQAFAVVPKIAAGFTLTNNGATVSLESGATILDTFTYPQLPEGVSAGRDASGAIVPFCFPTPGQINTVTIPTPAIVVQSGAPVGASPVTLNLNTESPGESMAGAVCHFDFGDGYQTNSCNPASHTMKTIGDYAISMTYKNYCGNTVTQSLPVSISPKTYTIHTSLISTQHALLASCQPTSFSGVTLSEVLPNPKGNETDGEWIELQNPSSQTRSLCGWSLDDGPGGSHPVSLSSFQIAPESFLLLPRSETKIAINNDHDAVRLIAPLPLGGTGIIMNVPIDNAPEGQSYAMDDQLQWNWTPYPTPGEANRFLEAPEAFASSPILLSAALPNPKGVDTWDEWVEITNTAPWPIWLNGWHLHNNAGQDVDLTGTVLSKLETKRILLSRLHLQLANEKETLTLIDTSAAIRSILSWAHAGDDVIERPYTSPQSMTGVIVRQVIDGDTLVVQMEKNDPMSLERVRLLGVDAPEIHDENPDISNESIL